MKHSQLKDQGSKSCGHIMSYIIYVLLTQIRRRVKLHAIKCQ